MPEVKTYIISAAVIILIAIASYFGFKYSAIASNGMLILDDFNHGLDLTIWSTYEEHHATNWGGGAEGLCGGSDADQSSYNLWNRSIIDTRVPYYECKPNDCSGTFVNYASPSEIYYSTSGNLSCATYTNPSFATTENCYYGISGWSASSCKSIIGSNPGVWASDCSHSKDYCYNAQNGWGCQNKCWTGTHTTYVNQQCGSYGFVQGQIGRDAYSLYHTIQVPAKASDQMNYVTVGWGQMSLAASSNSHTSYDNCNPYQAINSQVASNKLFSTEDIAIHYSYSGTDCRTDGCSSNIPVGEIWLGDKQMPINYNQFDDYSSRDYTKHTKTGFLEIKRYDDLDLSKYKIFVDGIEQGEGQNINPVPLIFKGSIKITAPIQYSPYFSCSIDKDTEVLVRDTFAAGSQINIHTLTYTPTKFCPQDLGVMIFSSKGLTNELGSITQRLANGETITVPEGEYYIVQYITKYVTDMAERCGVGQAYNIKARTCEQQAFQQIDNAQLFACNVDSDCLLPPNCEDVSATCQSDNKCQYVSKVCTQQQISNYVEVMKTLALQAPVVEKVNSGSDKVSFDGDATVAGLSFTSTVPKVLSDKCPVPQGSAVIGKGCYETEVTWGDETFTIVDGETKNISKYLSVTYHMTGVPAFYGVKSKRVYNYCSPTDTSCSRCPSEQKTFNYEFVKATADTCNPTVDWKNSFEVSFSNVFDVAPLQYQDKIELNGNNQLKLGITNHIFGLTNSGDKLKISKGLTDLYTPAQDISLNLPEGNSYQYIDLPSDTLGIVTVEIVPYFWMMDNQQYIADDKLVLGYYVQDTFDCHKDGCQYGICQDGSNQCIVNADCTTGLKCTGSTVCNPTTKACEAQTNCKENGCAKGETCNSQDICVPISLNNQNFIWLYIVAGALVVTIFGLIIFIAKRGK
jgi:hypothetical protein